MKNIIHAMIFGFKEILNWNTMKYALVSGILVSILWVGIGAMLWSMKKCKRTISNNINLLYGVSVL